MDPLSQGVFGALWASAASKKEDLRKAMALGALSGMAADLDVLISSVEDPLLALEYHRHFTHSLVFIPVGALICALVLQYVFRGVPFKQRYLYCFLGFASHGLLDAFTSYGTQLLWPFSNLRVAWDSIAIIDPFFTFPLLAALIICGYQQRFKFRNFSLVWATLYLALGFVQRDRAINEVKKLAESRGHTPLRVSAKPSIGNFWLFRGLYETDTHHYADAIRVPFFGVNKVYEGGSLKRIQFRDLPFPPESVLMKDIRRFAWFSDKALALSPSQPKGGRPIIIGDFRYSMLPNGVDPLWGILIEPSRPNTHVGFDNFRNIDASDRAEFWKMLMGR